MKILISLLFLTITLNARSSCGFKSEIKKVISLSGTVSVLLDETGLLSHPKVLGISVFNPIDEKKYKGKIYPGGLFLAQSSLNDFKEAIVFFDESVQLKKILKSEQDIYPVEILTRGKLPLDVVADSINVLRKYVDHCEAEFNAFQRKATTLQEKLLSKMPKNSRVIFYLGQLRGNNLPELVIANDGVVKLLKKENKISTYPSELAYVNWSARIMSSLPKETIHVGVFDPGMKNQKEIKRSSRRMTLSYPGSLVPGSSQLEAFLFWAESTY